MIARGADRRRSTRPAISSARSTRSPSGSARRSKRVEAVLAKLQTLEPTGVFARNLAECLTLQLRRARPLRSGDAGDDRQSAGARASATWPLLRKVCGVDDEDLADMIAEIKRLDPKPGRAFGDPPSRRRFPTSIVTGGAGPDLARRAQQPRRCRACWSTRSTRPSSSAARAARRTGNMFPPSCRRPTG